MISYLKTLTPAQWFGIILAILGVLSVSTAQLTDLLGPTIAKTIVTSSGLLTSILSSLLVQFTGQGAQIKAVQSMPGVDQIVVNKNANATLATIAVDPNSKVEAAPEALAAVNATAKAAS
jgi:drug/metabolite transporter (DMT)-like permease